MPLPRFARLSGKIIAREPGTRIVNGSKVADWSKPGPAREYQGWALPADTDEFNRARTAVRTGYNVYLAAVDRDGQPTVVYENSKVTLPDGNEYAVKGQPAAIPGPRGRTDHIFFYAERWAG